MSDKDREVTTTVEDQVVAEAITALKLQHQTVGAGRDAPTLSARAEGRRGVQDAALSDGAKNGGEGAGIGKARQSRRGQ